LKIINPLTMAKKVEIEDSVMENNPPKKMIPDWERRAHEIEQMTLVERTKYFGKYPNFLNWWKSEYGDSLGDIGKDIIKWLGQKQLFPKCIQMADEIHPSKERFIYLNEAIHHIIKKQKPPVSVPQFSTNCGAPWKIPRTLPGAATINLFLERSMATQMDSIPGTEFNECISSGDSLAICGVLFDFLGESGVRAHFNVGLLRFGDRALPMVWLTIQGTLIDNTYHHWPGMDKKAIESRLRSTKMIEQYMEEDPTTTKWPLINQLGSRSCVADPRLLKAYAKPEKIDQLLAFQAAYPSFYPNYLLFCEAFSKNAFANKTCVFRQPFVEDNLRQKCEFINSASNCWYCNKASMSLKRCQDCKLGLYCDAECQKADWADHRLLHKDREANRLFQEEAARKRQP